MLQHGNVGLKETYFTLGAQVSLIIEMIFEWRLEVGKRVDHMDIWGTSIPGRRNSQYKSLKAGICLVYSRNIKEPEHVEQTDYLHKNCHKTYTNLWCLWGEQAPWSALCTARPGMSALPRIPPLLTVSGQPSLYIPLSQWGIPTPNHGHHQILYTPVCTWLTTA